MLDRFVVKYVVYLFRWQLSTPLLAFVLYFVGNTVFGVVAANLFGGLVFFWIDKKILEEKKGNVAKKYLIYLARWQLTSITMYPVVQAFGSEFFGVFLANFFGGLIFFWVDRWIFTGKTVPALWEIKENVVCCDCGKKAVRGYRLVLAFNYDKRKDKQPEFRCEKCSIKKTKELRARKVQV